MTKTNKVLVGVVIVLLLGVIALLVWQTWFAEPAYYALYLRTGDIYFGKLVRFPYFGLKQVYLIQVNARDPANPLSIQRFANVFWGPEDFIKVNRDEVIWMTRLSKEGQLANVLRTNPNLIPPSPPAAPLPTGE